MTDTIMTQSSAEYNTFLKPYENEASTWMSKRRGIGASYLRKCGIKFNDALNDKLDAIGSLYPKCNETSFNAFMSDIKREGQAHIDNQPEQKRRPAARYTPMKARIKSFTAGNEKYGDAPCIRLFGDGTLVLVVAINNKHAYPALEDFGFKNDGSGSAGFTFNGKNIVRGERIACEWQITYGFIPGVDTSVLKIEKVEAMAEQQTLIQDDQPAQTAPSASPFGGNGLGKTPEQIAAEEAESLNKIKDILEKVEADHWWENSNIKTRYQVGRQATCKACQHNHGYTDPLIDWKPTPVIKIWECPRCHKRKHDSLMLIVDRSKTLEALKNADLTFPDDESHKPADKPLDLVEARKICKEILWPELFAEVKKLRPDITDKKLASQLILDYLEVKELADALINRGHISIIMDVQAFLAASAPFGEDTTGTPASKPGQPQAKENPPAAGPAPKPQNAGQNKPAVNPFKKATKKNSKLRLAIGGVPGGGKTFTALQIARELFPTGKVAVIDTESGSAEKYADHFDFDVLDLNNDYSPERYIELIHAAEEYGYDVLIVDSLSHEWTGAGGILDMVDNLKAKYTTKSGQEDTRAAWREASPRHAALISAILQSKIHIISTMRCKWKNVTARDDQKRPYTMKVIGDLEQREKIEYEFDIVAKIDENNNLKIDKSRCPDLTGYNGNRAGVEVARRIAKWLGIEQQQTVAQAS